MTRTFLTMKVPWEDYRLLTQCRNHEQILGLRKLNVSTQYIWDDSFTRLNCSMRSSNNRL